MRKYVTWLFAVLGVVLVGVAFVIRHETCQPGHSAAECYALADKLQKKQASKEQDKIRIYYEFKATEMADEEAWRKAVQEVEFEIAALSNAVVNCQAGR